MVAMIPALRRYGSLGGSWSAKKWWGAGNLEYDWRERQLDLWTTLDFLSPQVTIRQSSTSRCAKCFARQDLELLTVSCLSLVKAAPART